MTPEQLDHLRRIDAHLERLLELASKRTPGCWRFHVNNKRAITVGPISGPTVLSGYEFDIEDGDCDFIASCAGNAEAGWRATRATIDWLFTMQKHGGSQEIPRLSGLAEDILAAFPLESLKL